VRSVHGRNNTSLSRSVDAYDSASSLPPDDHYSPLQCSRMGDVFVLNNGGVYLCVVSSSFLAQVLLRSCSKIVYYRSVIVEGGFSSGDIHSVVHASFLKGPK